MNGKRLVWGGLVCLLALVLGATSVPAQKRGGVLNAVHRGNPPSLSIHQEATISTVWPVMPIYNNLVLHDPFEPVESFETIQPELASAWFWSQDGRQLTFQLRRGVVWHDGEAFTAADVKDTFDIVRGASDKRMRLNPRQLWYANVEEITTNGDYEVTFHLKRPQPALLALLASGYSPIHPEHIPPNDLRTKAVGTGPFRLAEFLPDQSMRLERNPDYWVSDRPYLDAINYVIIRSRASRTAALQAGQVDIAFPGETTVAIRDTLRDAVPEMVFHTVAQSVHDNIVVNTNEPPFNNLKLRQAVNLALDRQAMIDSVHQGGAVPGGANVPAPYGVYGLTPEQLQDVPGYGDPEANREQARRLLAEEGYGPGNPLEVTVSTRAIAIYVDTAAWVIDQLKRVGIDGTLEQVETGNWHAKVARRDFQLAVNLTGVGPFDPDANFYENYACGSQRNYSDYCNEEVMALFEAQSQEVDAAKRLRMVREIDIRLQQEVARPVLAHRLDYYAHWPHVKGLVPHNSIYNYGRMQEVWLDR